MWRRRVVAGVGVWRSRRVSEGVAEQTQSCVEESRLALEPHTSTAHEPTASHSLAHAVGRERVKRRAHQRSDPVTLGTPTLNCALLRTSTVRLICGHNCASSTSSIGKRRRGEQREMVISTPPARFYPSRLLECVPIWRAAWTSS